MGLGRAALAVVVQVQQIAAVLPLVWVSVHHRIEHRAVHLRRGLHAVKGVDIGDLSAQCLFAGKAHGQKREVIVGDAVCGVTFAFGICVYVYALLVPNLLFKQSL